MGYVYPVNLMTPRSRRKRAVKGGMFCFALVLVTLCFLAASGVIGQILVSQNVINCIQTAEGPYCSLTANSK